MKALVIGGTGPTGPHIVEGLRGRGYAVTILHRGLHEVETQAGVEHVHADPFSLQALEAALGERTFDLAIALYGRVREIAPLLEGRVGRLITASGPVYRAFFEAERAAGWAPVPVPHDAPLESEMAVSSHAALVARTEEVVLDGHGRGRYSATILRYPAVYGPRQVTPREWSIVRRILDGRRKLLLPDNGLALRSRGYAENVAAALLLVVDKPSETAGRIYNAADERALSLREWVTIIADALGVHLEYVGLPWDLAGPAQAYGARRHHQVYDLRPLLELGHRDVVSPEEAVARTARWYVEHPLPPDGELEGHLGDPFDYEAEGRIIDTFERVATEIAEIPASQVFGPDGYPYSLVNRP